MYRYTLSRIGSMVFVAFLLSPAVAVTQNPAPKENAGAYFTDAYPNLFLRNGHTERESRAKIEAAYQQLFHGQPDHQATAFDAGSNANGPLMYVTDWANHDVRTDGPTRRHLHPTAKSTSQCRFCSLRTDGATVKASTTTRTKRTLCSPQCATAK